MSTWLPILDGRLTDAIGVRAKLAGSLPHYVYVLCRPDGTPFYVGKGVDRRCLNHEAEARNTERLTHKLNVIRALKKRNEQVQYCIESAFDTEREAHCRERYLIGLFGRHDQRLGPLTNQTDGGEGSSNPSEESRERRRQSLWGEAEDEERRAANRWFQTICQVRSVPIKVLSGKFKPERLYANRTSFAPSSRQAAALAASAIANRVLIDPGAAIPRRLTVDGVTMAIENGVGRDILSSGMATLTDATIGNEVLSLTAFGFAKTLEFVGRQTLEDSGVLLPTIN
jgi:hypothetical protein